MSIEGWFFTVIWVGGFAPAFNVERTIGRGRLRATVEAVLWPFNFGGDFVATYYKPIE